MALEERLASFVKRISGLAFMSYIILSSCGCATCPRGMESISIRKHGFGPYIMDRCLWGNEYREIEN